MKVGRLVPPVGLTAGDVRSLEELLRHLEPDQRSLPGVGFERTAAWVEDAVGDRDLAVSVRGIAAEAPSYVEGCRRLLELIAERLGQAREVVGGGPTREGGSL
jgi:hypothetical protein